MDLTKQIQDKYQIPISTVGYLIIDKSDVWLDRVQLSKKLKISAKKLDRVLFNLGLFNLEEKKATNKAIVKNYIRFTSSSKGNLKELYYLPIICSILLKRKHIKKVKRYYNS